MVYNVREDSSDYKIIQILKKNARLPISSISQEVGVSRVTVQKKIQKLEDWNDFVEFEGKYYGIVKVYNNIHRENNCLGEMVFYKEEYKRCNCNSCENWLYGCSNPRGTYLRYYKCNKCNCEY